MWLQVAEVVEWALQRLDLSAHADKLASQYSGGNRRKLSAAIALLGSPPLLLLVRGGERRRKKKRGRKGEREGGGERERERSVSTCIFGLQDEPTSGVDPAARQFLWSVIKGVVSAGQSVLLTTHSMAECEALCARVGIMVNGAFHCLGPPQYLKSKYGGGYRLKLRVSGSLEPIEEFIRQNFPKSKIKVSFSLDNTLTC